MSAIGELSSKVITSDSQRLNSQPAKSSVREWLLFALVMVLSTVYLTHELRRSWIPADDGVLAESAERVLRGSLPHRDYHELYTGLLSYLNAVSFRAFGTNLASMRYVLLLFCVPWVSTIYYVASRFVSEPKAAAVTLLAVVWGPPNCATPMPSWYNLFFATFGLAALLRYIEVRTRRWLVLAGICGGISFLFKMTGLYFVAGVLLFLAFRETMRPSEELLHYNRSTFYRIFLVLSVFAYEALLLSLLRMQANAATYFYFWLPNCAIGATIIWYEFRGSGQRNRRFSFLFFELGLFGAGLAVPIAAFLTQYLLTGSLSPFWNDLLMQPKAMILSGSFKPPAGWFLQGVVVNLLLICVVVLTRSKTEPRLWEAVILGFPLALLIPAGLFLAQRARVFYQLVWSTIWVLAPLVVVVGIRMLIRRSMFNRLESVQSERLFITLSVTAACSLIQFPFTDPYYFCFIAPLVLLSATAVIGLMDQPPRLAVGGMMCFCFLYAVLELTPGTIFHLGVEYTPDIQTVRLPLPRGGGLLVSAATAHEYDQLGSLIRQHARGEYILAAPRCPEVYFLYGLRSPTRDFLAFSSDFGPGSEGVLRTLQAHQINFVVLNHEDSIFVQPVPNDLHSAVEMEFPSHAETENFEVRWKP
jgi:Dolichyl-phosphate-mannose-protein mannosyltransferase